MGCCEHGNELSVTMKYLEFLKQPRHNWLLKNGYTVE